jgi:ribonuclease R
VDILAVAHGFGLSLEFTAEVLEAAEEAAAVGVRDSGVGRVDRTDLLCFTIDPSDAKDHDDALSIEPVSSDLVEVGVHIADVSHFVRPGDPVDAEASARGTSVYLVDRAIPMLPAVLSSDVCSLRARAKRFAISLFMRIDAEGRVHERRYERTSIRCSYGLTYEEVQAVLEGSSAASADLDAALRMLDERARRVRAARIERGALDLDLPEAKVLLDEHGWPVDIQRRAWPSSPRR